MKQSQTGWNLWERILGNDAAVNLLAQLEVALDDKIWSNRHPPSWIARVPPILIPLRPILSPLQVLLCLGRTGIR